ncbi:MAG: hypothetical protein CM1200mP18_01540 [Gammaproteobacteria bacterium]|nr:MAG: hypothetical protein CM1200mP18_01540 [Gammaproteobacteria bacterium]
MIGLSLADHSAQMTIAPTMALGCYLSTDNQLYIDLNGKIGGKTRGADEPNKVRIHRASQSHNSTAKNKSLQRVHKNVLTKSLGGHLILPY